MEHARALALVATNTIRELVRSKLLYNLLVFAALFIAASLFVAQLTIGQWDRIILDMGLAAIELVGLLISMTIGVGLIGGEIERKTIFPTLAKPVARSAFLLGRYCGLVAILALNVALMGAVLAGVLRLAGYGLNHTTIAAAALILVELSLVAAAAMFFSSFTTSILASAFTLALFLIGHLLGDLRAFQERSQSTLTKRLAALLYHALPDLELLNLKSQAANGLPVQARFVTTSAAYGLVYAALLLGLAILLFRRRDLK
jgi:Cu-processing system permease protein